MVVRNNNNYLRCLNCGTRIFVNLRENEGYFCNACGWVSEISSKISLNIDPVNKILKVLENGRLQISYVPIDKNQLIFLPEKLRKAVEAYFNSFKDLAPSQYQNIYHNLYNVETEKLTEKIQKLKNKLIFIKFFKSINFCRNKSRNKKNK